MLHRLTEIARAEVAVEDEALGVTDLWIDAEDGRLRYVGLDIGGWMSRRTALMSVERMRYEGGWQANVTREEIEGAAYMPDGAFRLDMGSLPAILTGPFGNTISPLMISAGLASSAERTLPPPPDGGAASPAPAATRPEALTRSLERPEDWTGSPVFARDGEVGTLSDVMVEDADWTLAVLVIARGDARAAYAPWSALRHRAEGGHLVLAADTAQIDAAPAPQGPDDAAWPGRLADAFA